MKFGLQTLIALMTSIAIVFTVLRRPGMGILILLIVLPLCMGIIGLTSPQRANQLDPSKRWYLHVLTKTWVFSVVGVILMHLLYAASPTLEDRLTRSLNGDFRRQQFRISFRGDYHLYHAIEGKRLALFDSKGLVGEGYDAACYDEWMGERNVEFPIWLLVSTDRMDWLPRNQLKLDVELRPDGTLYIQDEEITVSENEG